MSDLHKKYEIAFQADPTLQDFDELIEPLEDDETYDADDNIDGADETPDGDEDDSDVPEVDDTDDAQ